MTEYSFILMVSAIIGAIAIASVKYDIRQNKKKEQLEKEINLLNRLQLKLETDRLEHINKVIEEIGVEDVSNKSE